jgi:RimJ/RimL family protein N-acetyltransferase
MRPGAGRLGRRGARGGRRLSGNESPPSPGGEVVATARLRLVPLRIEDAVEMTGVLADPALYAFTGGFPPSRDELRARYRHQVVGRSPDGREAWHNWMVRTRDPDEAVGFVQATITDGGGVADIAWVVGVPWQGRGFGTEAARAMVEWLEARGAVTITAHVHPDHAASARVAERAGLVATDSVEDGERVWHRDVSAHQAGAEPRT